MAVATRLIAALAWLAAGSRPGLGRGAPRRRLRLADGLPEPGDHGDGLHRVVRQLHADHRHGDRDLRGRADRLVHRALQRARQSGSLARHAQHHRSRCCGRCMPVLDPGRDRHSLLQAALRRIRSLEALHGFRSEDDQVPDGEVHRRAMGVGRRLRERRGQCRRWALPQPISLFMLPIPDDQLKDGRRCAT